MNYTETTINKLDSYFQSIVNSNKDTSYYINPMNNQKPEWLCKKDPSAFIRSEHHYCNWSFISYFDMGNNFKSFTDRKWFYVTETNDPNYVQLRKDLVDSWKKNSTDTDKDTVLVVTPNGVIPVVMGKFFGFRPLSYKVEWNNDGNVIYKYDISSQKEIICPKDYKASDETTEYFKEASNYIGKCNYAEHRTSNKALIIAKYNENNTLRNFHKMKSIKQAYDLLEVESKLGISYKTFQRLLNKNMVGYFIEIGNCKFWFKVEDPASNAIPETWGNETVEVSEESVEAISVNVPEIVSDNTEGLEKTIETTVNKVQEALPEIIKDNTDPVLEKPARIIIRVDTQVVSEHSDEEWCDLVNRMEHKRTIIRG